MSFADNTDLDSYQLGQKIREARERQGLSQEELASQLGLGQRAISELENGKRRLAVTEVPILAAILDVPLLYFLSDARSTTERDEILLEQFHLLPSDDMQQMVIDMVRLLVKTLV